MGHAPLFILMAVGIKTPGSVLHDAKVLCVMSESDFVSVLFGENVERGCVGQPSQCRGCARELSSPAQ